MKQPHRTEKKIMSHLFHWHDGKRIEFFKGYIRMFTFAPGRGGMSKCLVKYYTTNLDDEVVKEFGSYPTAKRYYDKIKRKISKDHNIKVIKQPNWRKNRNLFYQFDTIVYYLHQVNDKTFIHFRIESNGHEDIIPRTYSEEIEYRKDNNHYVLRHIKTLVNRFETLSEDEFKKFWDNHEPVKVNVVGKQYFKANVE